MTTGFALLRSTLAITVATAATLLTIAGSAAPAAAQTPRSIAIDTRGIDLTHPAGQARIADAIDRAAHSVCSTGDDRSAAAAMARHACIKASLAAAMPALAAASTPRTLLADAAPATVQR